MSVDRHNLIYEAAGKVLAFFAIFNCTPGIDDLHRYLGIEIDKGDLMREIKSLHGTEGNSEVINKLWKRVDKYKWVFGNVPFIRFAAVCNNLAFNAANEGSDIDLFIVTERNRIFTARFFLTLAMQILGIRRHGNKVSGRFCLSFYVSEDGLDLTGIRIKDDIYLDYWMASLKPVYGDLRYEIVKANRRTFSNFPNLKFIKGRVGGSTNPRKAAEFILRSWPGNLLEMILKRIQLDRYMKACASFEMERSVVVNDKMLKFHNRDRRSYYREQYLKNLAAMKS